MPETLRRQNETHRWTHVSSVRTSIVVSGTPLQSRGPGGVSHRSVHRVEVEGSVSVCNNLERHPREKCNVWTHETPPVLLKTFSSSRTYGRTLTEKCPSSRIRQRLSSQLSGNVYLRRQSENSCVVKHQSVETTLIVVEQKKGKGVYGGVEPSAFRSPPQLLGLLPRYFVRRSGRNDHGK